MILGQVQLIMGLFIEKKKPLVPSSQKLHYLHGKTVVTHLPCEEGYVALHLLNYSGPPC